MAASELDRLLGPLPKRRFIAEHFAKIPYASPGGADRLAALCTWERVERLFSHAGLDFLIARDGGRVDVPAPVSFQEVRRLYEQGHTLALRHVERHDPELARVADDFRAELCGTLDVHVYCTPPGGQGFGWHYDVEDVFIVQASGSKTYRIRKNTVDPWPVEGRLPRDLQYEREVTPVLECRLAPRDWLYIPSGWWHAAWAVEESLSLAIGIMTRTAIDVFRFLEPRLLASLLWRQRLPVLGAAGSTGPAAVAEYGPLLASLGDDLKELLASEPFAKAYVEAVLARGAASKPPE